MECSWVKNDIFSFLPLLKLVIMLRKILCLQYCKIISNEWFDFLKHGFSLRRRHLYYIPSMRAPEQDNTECRIASLRHALRRAFLPVVVNSAIACRDSNLQDIAWVPKTLFVKVELRLFKKNFFAEFKWRIALTVTSMKI